MVYQLARICLRLRWKRRVAVFSDEFCHVFARAPAKDDKVYQRIRAQAVSSMHRDTGYLTGSIEAGHGRPPRVNDDAGILIGWNAAHGIVRGWLDRHRLGNWLDA